MGQSGLLLGTGSGLLICGLVLRSLVYSVEIFTSSTHSSSTSPGGNYKRQPRGICERTWIQGATIGSRLAQYAASTSCFVF